MDKNRSTALIAAVSQAPAYFAYQDEANQPQNPNLFQRILLIVLAFLLGIGTSVAVLSLRSPTVDPVRTSLVSQIETRQDQLSKVRSENAQIQRQIDTLQNKVNPTQSVSNEIIAAQWTSVTGDGILITLDDASGSEKKSGFSFEGRVRDADIRTVINEMWQLGSSAVAVNGHRIGPRTTVRAAGSAILVDLIPLSPPYRIEALGDPENLMTGLAASRTGAYLSTLKTAYGIGINYVESKKMTLPPAKKPALRRAQPLVK